MSANRIRDVPAGMRFVCVAPVFGSVPLGATSFGEFPGGSPGAVGLGKLGFAINVTVVCVVAVSVVASARGGCPTTNKSKTTTMIFFTHDSPFFEAALLCF